MKQISKYQKTCPQCKSVQLYSSKYKLERALKKISLCPKCYRQLPSPKKQDLTGKIYGRLTVLSFYEKRGTSQYWLCQCDCGNTTVIRHSHLTKQTIRSCGCSHFYLKNKHPHWNGVGDLSGTFFSSVKQSAIVRGLKLKVSKEDMWNLFLKQNKKCALSGIDLQFQSRQRNRDGTASLDRIDSTKGYTPDNIQWVHKTVNIMKQDLSEAEFVNWCKLIVEKKHVKT